MAHRLGRPVDNLLAIFLPSTVSSKHLLTYCVPAGEPFYGQGLARTGPCSDIWARIGQDVFHAGLRSISVLFGELICGRGLAPTCYGTCVLFPPAFRYPRVNWVLPRYDIVEHVRSFRVTADSPAYRRGLGQDTL